MATKTGIVAAIGGILTVYISIAKVSNALLQIINELWQTTANDNLVTGSNVFWRNLNYKKQGNITYLYGYVINKFPVAKSNLVIANIPNSVYNAKTGQDTVFFAFTDNTGVAVPISISGGSIYLIGSLAPDQKIRFNLHYQTND